MSADTHCFEFEDLSIRVTYEGEHAAIAWSGMSEIQDPELSIGPFLKQQLTMLQGKQVTVDFRTLEYMNSATLQPVMKIIKELNQRSISTTVKYNNDMEWQRITFRCIKAVTQPLTHITFSAA